MNNIVSEALYNDLSFYFMTSFILLFSYFLYQIRVLFIANFNKPVITMHPNTWKPVPAEPISATG